MHTKNILRPGQVFARPAEKSRPFSHTESEANPTFQRLKRARRARGSYLNMSANSLGNFIPELWAREGIAILEENMVMGNLVNYDFSNEVRNFGETIHTRKVNEFVAYRKKKNTAISLQDATSTGVDVKLNQHIYTSFAIEDIDYTKSFADLITTYLYPAILSQARFVDQCLIGLTGRFIPYYGGRVGGLTTSTAIQYMLQTRLQLDTNKCPPEGRNLVLNPYAENELLGVPTFHEAFKVGDNGTALQKALLSTKFGFNTYATQNMPYTWLQTAATVQDSTLSAAATAGSTANLAITTLGAAPAAGEWFVVDGQINRLTGSPTTTAGPPLYPLKANAASGSAIRIYKSSTIGASYLIGDEGPITIASATYLQAGQWFSIAGHAKPYYVVRKESATTVYLDRPLDAAITSGDAFYPMPHAGWNLAFDRGAMTVVTRPMASVPDSNSAVVSSDRWSFRVAINYIPTEMKTLVTVDGLFGTQVLDELRGAVLLG